MRSGITSVYVITAFFVTTIAIAFYYHRQFPALAVAGEASPGTWLSGALLSCTAGAALVIAIHRGWNPWSFVAIFFFILAADEHFMLHERGKQWLLFNVEKPTLLIRELPVFIAVVIGAWTSWRLWTALDRSARSLLLAAIFFGLLSVTLDVISAAAVWEEVLKLVAEFLVACALLTYSARSANPRKDANVS